MEKLAPSDHDVHDLIRKRWSPRSFSARKVGTGELRQLLEAARWAASCFNEQPWRFIVATIEDRAEHARLLSCLAEKNQMWAQKAPVLMISVAKRTFAHNGKPNHHARHDVGQAAAQMAIQATALGLIIHQMAGFSSEQARVLYSIPDDFDPVAAIAVGYQGAIDDLPEIFREMEAGPRVRRSQETFAFSSDWEKAL